MLKMTRRIGRLSGLIAAGVAIVGTGSGVMAASYSAFSTTTQNAANSWNTGSVALSNDTASAMFSGTNQQMNAGVQTSKCITVTSSGTLTSTVKLYAGAFSDTNSLGQHIALTINVGSGSTNPATCAGFVSSSTLYTGTLSAFSSAPHTNYANGVATTWTPTGTAPESKQFQFIWSYDSTTPMSSSATATFTWETQGS